MVTGRQLDDLNQVFPHLDWFDCIIAENGALLFFPDTQTAQLLGDRPPEIFIQHLRDRGVHPLSVGQVIVATWTPHETIVMQTIQEWGLELQIILNKGAVMVLPAGLNKAAGLTAALTQMGLSAHRTVGVGDAENDHAFLDLCGVAVAVANALPALREHCDWVTQGSRGDGVVEVIDAIVESDLGSFDSTLRT
jgi:hydroxymethylpyrimidine pyrophosphatase-like HAD family hydrolase